MARPDDVDEERDRQLVIRVQQGDTTAFEELYRRYYRRVWRACRRSARDSAEAEDLAQQAFELVWRALPNVAGEQRFFAYLSVVARRLCRDEAERRALVTPAGDIETGVPPVGDPADATVDEVALAAALRTLPPRQRQVVQSRIVDGESRRRTASRLAMSSGQVDMLLAVAMATLRRELAHN